MRRKILLIGLLVILALIIAGALLFETQEQTQLKMGTFVRIVLHGERWKDFDSAFKEAFSAIDGVDKMANMYDPESELSKLNRNAPIEPVTVSDDLFKLIRDSVKLSKDSDGAFDITIAPLVRLWQDYREDGSSPAGDEVKKALSLVGYDQIVLDESEKSVFFKKEGVAVDLSAIAKGFAVDRAIAELKKCGFRSAVVSAGGDLYCLGKKYFLKSWRIGITDPEDKKSIKKILYLKDEAAATSGGYEQHFSYQGKEFTHIIDTKTGYPDEVRFSSVTVVAPSCMIADGVATAVLAGGEDIKRKLSQSYPGIDIMVEN